MVKRKKLPSSPHKGLCIYCSHKDCKKYFFWTSKLEKEGAQSKRIEPICKKDNVKFSNCRNFDKHKYMARLCVPNSTSRVSKTFEINQYNEAVKLAIEFESQLKRDIEAIDTSETSTKRSAYLFNVQAHYIDFLHNIGVPDHEQKKRSEKHIKEQIKCLKLFNEALAKHGINKKILPLHKVTSDHVGFFHTYLLEDMKYFNKTYNNKMGAVKSFFGWAIDKYNLEIKNPLEKVKERSVSKKIDTITAQEFKALIDPKNMNYDNGWAVEGKAKKRRNKYKDYLAVGIELCLHTGGRREEVVQLTWNMIHEIDNKPAFIELKNYKVERSLGEGFNDNVAPSIIPVTIDLKKLLDKLGYKENRGMEDYILCPDRTSISTYTIMNDLSRGFTHFYKRLNTGRQLQMKCLRKTYLTHLNNALKGNAKSLSSHSTNSVLKKHYIDEKVLAEAVAEMSILET